MEIAITVMEDEELQLNNNNENLKNVDRKLILNKVLTTHHQDNFNLLSQIKHRLHRYEHYYQTIYNIVKLLQNSYTKNYFDL